MTFIHFCYPKVIYFSCLGGSSMSSSKSLIKQVSIKWKHFACFPDTVGIPDNGTFEELLKLSWKNVKKNKVELILKGLAGLPLCSSCCVEGPGFSFVLWDRNLAEEASAWEITHRCKEGHLRSFHPRIPVSPSPSPHPVKKPRPFPAPPLHSVLCLDCGGCSSLVFPFPRPHPP